MAVPEQIKAHIAMLRKNLKDIVAHYEARSHEFKILGYLSQAKSYSNLEMSTSNWLTDGRVQVTVRVRAFPDVLPLLEQLSNWGYDFKSTRDWPQYNDRHFISDRIEVIAHLVGEGTDDCRKVIVGYTKPSEPQPIYEFQCGKQDAPPANPNPQLPEGLSE